ncbi:MAG: hypothetical protein JJE01_06190 [Gemmatimonadetes bacterium]|nr:hypothetical protein [Gemmatimonadota bacterium]
MNHERAQLRRRIGAIGLMLVLAGVPASLLAQDPDVPRFPFGTPVVFVPVQSVQPLEEGGWPGGAVGEEDALRAMDAELEFVLAESRGGADWALPSTVIRRVDRNPILRIDPTRLAYQGLLEKPVKRKQIYEPLHSELRLLSALFDTRYVILPIALFVELDPPELEDEDAEPDSTEAPEAAAPDPDDPAVTPDRYRAHLLLAMIDIRMSSIVWWGEIVSDQGAEDSPALLASLAENVAAQVAPS